MQGRRQPQDSRDSGPSPRRNRVDPWGDLHRTSARGLFTGNRGCLVDDHERVVRHHASNLWITCLVDFRGRRIGLARPRRWTPVFFLDEAVALAAGHRPCAYCRRAAYNAYRDAVGRAEGASRRLLAPDLNARLAAERYRPGRGMTRAQDRILWESTGGALPDGTIVAGEGGGAQLVSGGELWQFRWDRWAEPRAFRSDERLQVLTPPTSVGALRAGYEPVLHPSAGASLQERERRPPGPLSSAP